MSQFGKTQTQRQISHTEMLCYENICQNNQMHGEINVTQLETYQLNWKIVISLQCTADLCIGLCFVSEYLTSWLLMYRMNRLIRWCIICARGLQAVRKPAFSHIYECPVLDPRLGNWCVRLLGLCINDCVYKAGNPTTYHVQLDDDRHKQYELLKIFSNSPRKSLYFDLHCNLFPNLQLPISQH